MVCKAVKMDLSETASSDRSNGVLTLSDSELMPPPALPPLRLQVLKDGVRSSYSLSNDGVSVTMSPAISLNFSNLVSNASTSQ